MFGAKISLEPDLLKRCKEHAKAAGYSSVEEFIHHVLERALRDASPAATEGEEEVLARLKGLGYVE